MQKTEQITYAQARKTCLVVTAAAMAAAAFAWYRASTRALYIAVGVAVVLLVVGVAIPPLALLFHRVWMTLAHALGWINSRIILTAVYLLAFVPYKVISRLAGRDPLAIRSKRGESYWIEPKRGRQEREGFERLF